MDRLLDWAALPENNITVHPHVDLATPGSLGHQGTALCDLWENSCLATIPFDSIITPDLAAASFGLDMNRICKDDLESGILAIYLIKERASPSSRWKPYIDVLPTAFETPLYWAKTDLEWLSGTNLDGETQKRIARLTTQLAIIEDLAGESVTIDDWIWAHSVINSRSFPSSLIHSDQAVNYPILIPVLDTFNHTSPLKITWQPNYKDKKLSFISHTSYTKGEQVFNNYGAKSNEEFLMSYGFCVDNIDTDHVSIKLQGSERTHYITIRDPLPPTLLAEFGERLGLNVITSDTGTAREGDREAMSVKDRVFLLSQLHGSFIFKLTRLQNHFSVDPQAQAHRPPTSPAHHAALLYRTLQIRILTHAIEHILATATPLLTTSSSPSPLLPSSPDDERIISVPTILQDARFSDLLHYGFGVTSEVDVRDAGVEDILLVLYLHTTHPPITTLYSDNNNSDKQGHVETHTQESNQKVAEAEDQVSGYGDDDEEREREDVVREMYASIRPVLHLLVPSFPHLRTKDGTGSAAGLESGTVECLDDDENGNDNDNDNGGSNTVLSFSDFVAGLHNLDAQSVRFNDRLYYVPF